MPSPAPIDSLTTGCPFELRDGVRIERGGVMQATLIHNPPGWNKRQRLAMLEARAQLAAVAGEPTARRVAVRVQVDGMRELGVMRGNGFDVVAHGVNWTTAFARLDVAALRDHVLRIRTEEARYPARRSRRG